MERVNVLIEKNSKYSILIMTIFFFTVVPELDFILAMWLKVVPEGTSFLCLLTLVDALVRFFGEGTNGYVQASGKIKWFQVTSSIILLSNLPLGYVLFLYGFPAYWIIICFILTSILYRFIGLYLMSRLLDFNVRHYIKNAYARPIYVIIIMIVCSLLYSKLEMTSTILHLTGITVMSFVTTTTVFMIGFSKEERKQIINIYRK